MRHAAGHKLPAKARRVAPLTRQEPASVALPWQFTCLPELPPMHRRTLLGLAALPLLAARRVLALDLPEGPVVL